MKNNEEKFRAYFWLMNKWMYLRNIHESLIKSPIIQKKKKIAIYGLGHIGKRLIEELQNEEINIEFVIDQNAPTYFADFNIFTLNEEFPEADLIIVSVICDFDQVRKDLNGKTEAEIVSLETIIDELWIEKWTSL